MPHSHQIDVARRLVVSRTWGTISSGALEQHYTAIAADPAFRRTFRQLAHVLIEPPIVDLDKLSEIVHLDIFDPGVRRAFYAPRDDQYDTAQRFAALSGDSSQNVRVFRTVAGAEAWLGVDASSGDDGAGLESLDRPDSRVAVPPPSRPDPDAMRRVERGRAWTLGPDATRLSREFKHIGGSVQGTLTVRLVPRPSTSLEVWQREPRDSRLRMVTRTEVRYVVTYPAGWALLGEAEMLALWERGEPC